MFCGNLESPVWVKLFAPPIWLPENSANIWSLLWLYGGLFIQTEPTNFYKSTFPNTLTPKKATYYREKCIFFHKRDRSDLLHTALTLNVKMRLFPNQERYWAEKL